MTQHDMNIANADGSSFRADLNVALQAIAENNSGATAPSTTFSYQLWADTANDLMKIRNAANSAWIVLFKLSTGGFEQGAGIDSADGGGALVVLADGVFNDVTGTTGITSINSLGIGSIKWLQFDGALTITHHATNLILPEGRSIKTTAGDILCFYEYASGDWRLLSNTANSLPFRKGADIATNSAGNLTPGSDGNAFDVTGTDGVTSIDAVAVGTYIILRFDDIVALTHDGTNLDLGGSSLMTVAGQILTFHEYASGDWRMVSNSVRVTGQIQVTDVTVTGSAASTPDANTLTKDHLIGARCTFNGTGTPAYIEEINFSGAITDSGVGDYILTIDRDFADANYTAVCTAGAVNAARIVYTASEAVGSIVVQLENDSGVRQDTQRLSVTLIGEQ